MREPRFRSLSSDDVKRIPRAVVITRMPTSVAFWLRPCPAADQAGQFFTMLFSSPSMNSAKYGKFVTATRLEGQRQR